MHKIIKISDLKAILSHYSAEFIQEQVKSGELDPRFSFRRVHAHATPMAMLRALYERLLAEKAEYLSLDDLREYAGILTAPELQKCGDIFAHDWTLSELAKLNRTLRYFAVEGALTDDVIKCLANEENQALMLQLLPVLEHGKFYQFATERPVLSQEQYLYLFHHHEHAHALVICFAMLALNNKEPAELNAVLFEALKNSAELQTQMQQINCNCVEGYPWQNISAGQPLTRALDVLRNENITPAQLIDLLTNLSHCEDKARVLKQKDNGLQGSALLFGRQSEHDVGSTVNAPARLQYK